MKGDGFYDAHSQVQSSVIHSLVPLIQSCVNQIPAPENGKPFCIVDYGCSEGKNSIAIVGASIDAVRALRPSEHFFVVHEDLPANNFNRLISQLYNSSSDKLATTYGATLEYPVFVYASGSSFYSRVVPDSFVHLGISSSSVHWTSSHPQIKNHIFHAEATATEQAQYAEIAKKDWLLFLENRCRELLPGGKLVVTMAARIASTSDTIEGSNPRKAETFSAQSIGQLLCDVLQEMAQDDLIERDAFEQFSLPIFCRSREEILSPVDNAFAQQLQVDYFKMEWVQCPLHAKFMEDRNAAAYASGLTGILRAFSEPILSSGLFGVTDRRASARQSSDAQKVIDRIYEKVEQHILEQPDSYSFYPCHATLILSRL
jgi:hypothetical protein